MAAHCATKKEKSFRSATSKSPGSASARVQENLQDLKIFDSLRDFSYFDVRVTPKGIFEFPKLYCHRFCLPIHTSGHRFRARGSTASWCHLNIFCARRHGGIITTRSSHRRATGLSGSRARAIGRSHWLKCSRANAAALGREISRRSASYQLDYATLQNEGKLPGYQELDEDEGRCSRDRLRASRRATRF